MKKLVESKKKVNVIGAPDARAAFIQYSQILLTKNLRQYLETVMLPSSLMYGDTKTLYQKIYELQLACKNLTWTLRGAKDNLTGSKFR